MKMDVNEIISNVEVYGLEKAIRASKFPMSVNLDALDEKPCPRTYQLGNSGKGEGHDNFLKGILVNFDLCLTVKAWTEAERYHWFEIVSSQSTMHRIAMFDVESQCIKYVDKRVIAVVQELADKYKQTKDPEDFLALVYTVPVGFRLTAAMTTNYRQLKTLYAQRRTHRLPEWQAFCDWCEQLPLFAELCLGKKPEEQVDEELESKMYI